MEQSNEFTERQPRDFAKAKSGYIERRLAEAGGIDETLVDKYREKFRNLQPAEKAWLLFRKVMSEHGARVQEIRKRGAGYFDEDVVFDSDRETGSDKEEKMDDLLSLLGVESLDTIAYASLKALWEDEEARDLFLDTYKRGREEVERVLDSDLFHEIDDIDRELELQEDINVIASQKLLLQQYNDDREREALRQVLEEAGEKIDDLNRAKNEKLDLSDKEPLPEYTDVLALRNYKKIVEYSEQKFVWTESRKEILRKIIAQMGNGRSMVALVGEAGTGKSELAVAAAIELTGEEPLFVQCTSETTEYDLIKSVATEGGDTYEKYGPVMQAFTGYNDSRQTKPDTKRGRIVRLDEFNLLGINHML